jgi:hypothetical protein
MIREHIPHSKKLQQFDDLFIIFGFSCGDSSAISGAISLSFFEVSI